MEQTTTNSSNKHMDTSTKYIFDELFTDQQRAEQMIVKLSYFPDLC